MPDEQKSPRDRLGVLAVVRRSQPSLVGQSRVKSVENDLAPESAYPPTGEGGCLGVDLLRLAGGSA